MVTQGSRIGPYTVAGLVGSGATAEVWRVTDDAGIPFALKVLTHRGAKVAARLEREGRILARLLHPNIVRVVEPLSLDGRPALVLEWVAGPTLETWAREPRPLPDIERMIHGIATGLAYAHTRGVVHRDLKPANILLAEGHGGTFVPKIADFGIARADDGLGQTQHGAMLGTPRYMAPEQIRDASGVDGRADLFALGCLLYEWVVGRLPFPDVDPVGRWLAVQHGPPDPGPEVPPRFREALLAALAPEPDDRPPGVAEWLLVLGGAHRSEIPDRRGQTWIEEPTGVLPVVRPLVGRRDEVAAIERSLAAGRAVHVTGAPGIGKTRVAQELIARRGGVRIDLAGASDPGPIWTAVARGLQLPLSGSPDALESSVLAALAGIPLVVLDGADAAAEVLAAPLAAWRRAVPRVAWIVCSSRADVAFDADEVVLGPLSPDEARLLAGDSVPEAMLARMGGHPLALSLAGAGLSWTDERTGDTLGRMWEALPVEEQSALTRLAVFPAGFSADEVDAVYGAGAARPLDALRARFLLEPHERGWQVVGVFRTLANERGDTAERSRAGLAHREWVWRSVDEDSALDHARIRRLAPDIGAAVATWRVSDPPRAATLAYHAIANPYALPEPWISWLAEWAVDDRRVPLPLRVRTAQRLAFIWLETGMKPRSDHLVRKAVDLASGAEPLVRLEAAIERQPLGTPLEERVEELARLQAEAEAVGATALVARAQMRRIVSLRSLGRAKDAEVVLSQVRTAPELGLQFEFDRLNLIGILHATSDRTVTAERAFASARAIAAGFGCPVYEGRALMNLGTAAGLRGDADRALRWFAEAEAVVARGGDPIGMAQLLGNRAVARLARRELAAAEDDLERADTLLANRHNPEIASWIAAQRAGVDEVRGRIGLAEGRLRQSMAIAHAGSNRFREAIAVAWLAGVLAERRHLDEARALLAGVTFDHREVAAHLAYSQLALDLAEGLSRAAALERLAALDAAAPLQNRHRGWALERAIRGRTR